MIYCILVLCLTLKLLDIEKFLGAFLTLICYMNIPKSQSVFIPLTIFRGALLNLAGFIALIHPLMQQIGLYLKRRFTGRLAKDL
jgi:hypothetical protein